MKKKKTSKSKPDKRNKHQQPVIGKFVGNTRGFGFVVRSDGGLDIFIQPSLCGTVIHGDEVVCKIFNDEGPESDPRGPSGEITEITNRGTMVGTFFIENEQGFVKPIERRIPYDFTVSQKTIKSLGLADGHRVVFSVDKSCFLEDGITPCFIIEILGHIHDPGVDVLTLVRKAGVPYEFPENVQQEALELADGISDREIDKRLDLRSEEICTIDGEDTKDIDDGISLKMSNEGHFILGVHIADVSHYVKPQTALDEEALKRGTSIYLADRVIPMLPHRLSSGICSLVPNADRLALSCIMTIDPSGTVVSHKIKKTVIRSKRRFTYAQVQDMLDNKQAEDPSCEYWLKMFNLLNELREILRAKRDKRGALNFNIPESKIRVNEEGWPILIEPYPRTHATEIIEECMILCNETVASHFFSQKIPFIYRTHESPGKERITKLGSLIKNFGIKTPRSVTKPARLQKLLTKTKDKPYEYSVAMAVLQSLPQAHYTTINPSHYGLASEAYTHFTSPIRRYPDLQVHRIIKEYLENPDADGLSHYSGMLPMVCVKNSKSERDAEALEREVSDLKKVQYMTDHKGEYFSAVVNGVAPWGIFVMLPNTVEGLVPMENLRKHGYTFNKDGASYETKKSNAKLWHGTEINVRLVNVDVVDRRLSFVLA